MQWISDLAGRESEIIGPLAEWLQDGDRCYEDIPPGLREEVFFQDLRSGEVHACAAWKSMGHGIAEMENGNWQNYVHPDDMETTRSNFHNCLYKKHIRVGQSIFRVRDSRGRYRWILSSSAVISRSGTGEAYRYIGRDVDINNRLENELTLQKRILEIEDETARERTLMEAAGNIAGSTDGPSLLDSVENACRKLVFLDDVRIVLSDASGFRLALGTVPPRGFAWENLQSGPSATGTRGKDGVYLWNLGSDGEGRGLALLFLAGKIRPETDSLLSVLGPFILGAWDRVRNLETLRRHASTDPLTGSWNRRAFEEMAGRSIRRCREESRTSIVAILDIDFFKAVNDEFGHPFGDRILVDVAAGIRDTLRSVDFMSRWGGEEFALWLNGIDDGEALGAVDRIRIAAGKAGSRNNRSITLSAGLFVLKPDSTDSLNEALARADEALFKSKSGGRNRSTVHEEFMANPADNYSE